MGVDGGGPAAVFVDEAVVGSAGQGQFVDVGVAVVGPVAQGVVDLAAVGGYGAAGFGAAAVAGDEHDPLRRRGDPFGAKQVQRLSGGVVEDGQPVMGVPGQADDVFDRHEGAAAGGTNSGAGFEVLQGGADDDRGRQAVVLTQLPGFQGVAPDGDQRVVLSLGEAAVIGVDLFL